MFHLSTSKASVALSFVLLYSRHPIPLLSLCNIQHPSLLTPLCEDMTRQTNVNAVWVDGRGVVFVAEMWQDSQPSTKKVTWPISLEHGWELPRQQISSVDEGWYWRRSMGSVCVRAICHLDRCLCCLSFWCRPTSVSPWWLVTIVWHVPTKCLASGGQAHVLPLFFFFSYLAVKESRFQSFTVISLFFFFSFRKHLEFPWRHFCPHTLAKHK